MVKRNKRRPVMRVTGGGTGIVNHAGTRLLCEVADAVGLSDGLSAAMAPSKQRRRAIGAMARRVHNHVHRWVNGQLGAIDPDREAG